MQNALKILGVRVGQHKLARIVRGSDDGTDGADEQDVLRALGDLGCSVDILDTNRRRDADLWLKKFAHAAPLMISVDHWEHWVCLGGGCSARLWLFDPEKVAWNTAENGSWPLLPKTILKRWRAARRLRAGGGQYYGIAILSADVVKAKRCTNAATED